jgi:4-amino-4-deoxy-L-arabinose transferase-like glycosyltransferase
MSLTNPGVQHHKPLLHLLLVFAGLHLLLMAWDHARPEVFLFADRGAARWGLVQQVHEALTAQPHIDQDRLAALLSGNGNPGDYLVQALLWLLAGEKGVVLAQVVLVLCSGAAVSDLGRALGLQASLARWTAALYLAWPHTLVFAHQLATEAWHTPMLVIGTAAFVRALRPDAKARWWVGAACVLGLAALIRPVTLLWPLTLGLMWVWACRSKLWHSLQFVCVAMLPVLLWSGWMASQTGVFGVGASSRDAGHNLYQRVSRITATLPAAQRADAQQRFLGQGRKTLALADYAAFVQRYPVANAGHLLRDASVFLFKSGWERLPIDYFGADAKTRAALQNSDVGWRKQFETQGAWATISWLWARQGPALLLGLLGAMAMSVVWCLALFGVWRAFSNGRSPPQQTQPTMAFVTLVLAALVLYIALMSTVVDTVQSRHRAPAEFALLLLSASGLHWLGSRRLRGLPHLGQGKQQY